MPYDAHLAEGFAVAQIVQSRSRVAGKVLARGIPHVAALGGPRGTVVVAQRGNAVTGQIVGNHEERLVVVYLLVAVLLSAARHKQGYNGLPLRAPVVAHGPCQRSRQCGTVLLVAERHLLRHVRQRRLRCLRTLQRLLRAPLQHQRQREAVLFERAVEAVALQPSAVGRVDAFHAYRQRVVRQEHLLGGNTLGALVGTVHRHLHQPVGLLQMQHQRQLGNTQVQLARPRAEQRGCLLCGCRRRDGSEDKV